MALLLGISILAASTLGGVSLGREGESTTPGRCGVGGVWMILGMARKRCDVCSFSSDEAESTVGRWVG